MDATDIEAMERAAVAAVAPPEVLEIGGWLVPLDRTPVGRARSAVPLSHRPRIDILPDILAAYAARSLPAALRVADAPGLAAARQFLTRRGLSPSRPTFVKVGDVARLAAFADGPVEMLTEPDEGFASVFLGEGFDPEEGEQRLRVLRRSPNAVYASVREDGRTVAAGVGSFGHGWGGIHGMRTALDARGRGHAGAILAALGREMQARGMTRVQLQVEEANPARDLYEKAGFESAWRYRYWASPRAA